MGLRIQPRDTQIFQMLFFHGILSQFQVWTRWFPGKTKRAVQKRMEKLHSHDYIHRSTMQLSSDRRLVIYWLNWRGILYIAGQRGIEVEGPKNEGERQMRLLETRLRKQGIGWNRDPYFGKVEHDLKVADVHWAVLEASAQEPVLKLEEWIPETAFRAKMDRVRYEVLGNDRKVRRGERGVVPDGYFTITNEELRARGQFYRVRFLLEVDMANHSNPTFGRQKVAPYSEYVASQAYKARFGSSRGFWLVTATGRRRVKNLMSQTLQVAGRAANLFYFTTGTAFLEYNILTDPIWWQAGRKEPLALFRTRE